MLQELVAIQALVRESISADLAAYGEAGGAAVLAAMVPTGVLFGAVHALTPGHGKLLLAGYVAGARVAATRAIVVAAALSATHVGMAVAIAGFGLPLVTRTLGGVGEAPVLEAVSRGIMIAIGIWFMIRAARPHRHWSDHGIFAGVAAGFIPCPLTLFVMTMSIARGMPEAGLAFAAAMLIGIGAVLTIVALAAALTRGRAETVAVRHGVALDRASRAIQGAAGLAVVTVAIWEIGS